MVWGQNNAFTHLISMDFILMDLFTITCVIFHLFHMENPG